MSEAFIPQPHDELAFTNPVENPQVAPVVDIKTGQPVTPESGDQEPKWTREGLQNVINQLSDQLSSGKINAKTGQYLRTEIAGLRAKLDNFEG